MMGEFHLHADEGGLNRGIHGVVYNQASKPENEILDLAPVAAPARPATSNARVYTQAGSSQSSTYYQQAGAVQHTNQARPNQQTGGNTRIVTADIINAMKAERGQGYYSPNHGTKMNQGVNGKKDASASVVTIVVVVVIILSMLMSMFD
jgi:cobalamin biosynthesis Mg chelatase CobN